MIRMLEHPRKRGYCVVFVSGVEIKFHWCKVRRKGKLVYEPVEAYRTKYSQVNDGLRIPDAPYGAAKRMAYAAFREVYPAT